jgi:hypothetical protein
VPAGQVIYDSLKTSFVDFPRLVRTLERESYTGYVRLLSDKSSGLILFRDGRALECVFDSDAAGGHRTSSEGLAAFNKDVAGGQGVLDVVSLTPDLVEGLHELIVADPIYGDLYSSWVDMRSLVEFLRGRRLTGNVLVRSTGGTGVIILKDGTVVGAYTSESREIATDVESVLALCDDRDAVIEVRQAQASERPAIDVDRALGAEALGAEAPAATMPTGSTAAAAATPGTRFSGPTAEPGGFPNPTPPPTAPQWAPPPSNRELGAAGGTAPLPAAEPLRATPPAAPLPQPSAAVAPAARPVVTAQPAVARTSAGATDWNQVVSDLQAMAEEALGNRSRKVKDILGGAERSQAGVEAAIDQVPAISLLFVDSSRLESLAQDMRTRLRAYV